MRLVPERYAQRRVFVGTLESVRLTELAILEDSFVLWPEVLRITVFIRAMRKAEGAGRG